MRYLPWREAGRGICGGRGGRDGVAIGMEGNGGRREGRDKTANGGKGRGRRRKERE